MRSQAEMAKPCMTSVEIIPQSGFGKCQKVGGKRTAHDSLRDTPSQMPLIQGATTRPYCLPSSVAAPEFLALPTLRVTRIAPCERDMAAIWQSAPSMGRPSRRRREAISA